MKISLKNSSWLLVSVSVLMSLLSLRAPAEGCAPGVPQHPQNFATEHTCPIAGKMGGAKLAIPGEYLFGPIEYKGVNIWDPKTFKNWPTHPNFENDIDDFGIVIRLTNFRPRETQSDERDFDLSEKSVRTLPPSNNRWIMVGIDTRHYPINPTATADYWHKDEPHRGPYNRQPDEFGLMHFVSERQPSTTIDSLSDQYEYFYDAENNSTFIFCQNGLRKVPPYDLLTSCHIKFNVPQIQAQAEIMGIRDKADLARWPEMEAAVIKIVSSFVVP